MTAVLCEKRSNDALENRINQSQQQNEMLLQQVLREALEVKTNIMITVESRGERLIFKDYGNREISINQNDYLQLIASPQRQALRPILEEALLNPSEVYTVMEKIDEDIYHYYKYFKFFKKLVFIAIVMVNDDLSFELNNFYGYDESQFDEAEKERTGSRVVGNL